MLRIQRPAHQQPQDWPEIDWSNLIAQELAFAILPSIGLVNLVTGERPIAATSTPPTREPGQVGIRHLGTGSSYAEFAPNGMNSAGNRMTILSLWRAKDGGYNSGDATRSMLSCRTAGNAGWTWGRDGATAGGALGNVTRQSLIFQGVAQYFEGTSSIESLADRAVCLRISGTTASFFKDGQKSSADATVGTSSTGGNLVFMAQGPYSGAGQIWNDRQYITLAWRRPLTDAEIASISANPWQLFVRKQYFPVEVAGGGTHDATGALANAGGQTSGAAARTRAHPSMGALSNPGGEVSGSALHLRPHAATGALVNPGATTAGAAARRVNHAGTGALANPGATLAGTADRAGGAVTHASSGALVNAGAQLAGTARHNIPHPATGALANLGAALAGAANRTPAPVSHAASGALTNPGALLVGFATNDSGALVDTHDGFWAKQYRKMWERKTPTIAEIVQELEEEPQEILQAVPEVRKEVARDMGGRIDYQAIANNLELQRIIAKQIQVAIELRYAQHLAEIDEEDAEVLLLI